MGAVSNQKGLERWDQLAEKRSNRAHTRCLWLVSLLEPWRRSILQTHQAHGCVIRAAICHHQGPGWAGMGYPVWVWTTY